MKIGNVDLEKDILIVAEIGNNHEGNFDLACRLIHEAATCGVDAVKFQTYKTELFISKQETQERYNRLKRFELSYDNFRELAHIAHKNGILFFSTPLDLESAAFLEEIVDAYKVASGDITFFPLLEQISQTKLQIILSTGASTEKDIQNAINVILKNSLNSNLSDKLVLLHCVSCYPPPLEQINLLSIPYILRRFGLITGFSDHTIGIEIAQYAAVLGARIIEKHFTIDKSFSSFRDHQLSANPQEMQELVKKIRRIQTIFGNEGIYIMPCETDIQKTIRRSIALQRTILTGEKINFTDIIYMRPGIGLSPEYHLKVIGKSLKSSTDKGNILTLDNIMWM